MTVNANNYEGAEVTVVGKAGSAPQTKFEGRTTEVSIAVGQGYKKNGEWVDTGTVWYSVQASTEYAEQNWPNIEAGDKVRVDGAKQEIRVYSKNDGTPGVEVRLSYANLKVVDRKADRVAANGVF